MIAKIAWKNIWRHKVRSLVVITAIALGLWAGVFASAFVKGMMTQKVDSVIRLEMSHFQIHVPGFRDEMLPDQYISNGEEIQQIINKNSKVEGTAGRVISTVMIASANYSGAIKAVGISPKQEARVTQLNRYLEKGQYFEGVKRNPIYVSHKIADKYKIDVGSKIVLTLQDVAGEITAGSFRVCGIFNTGNNPFDQMNVFVRKEDLQKLLKVETGLHEIAILLKEHDQTESMTAFYQEKYPELEVLSWMDLAAGMRYMVEIMDVYTLIIVGIILVALLFSIINTMLMAVLERVRELGMLMAIGMTKQKVFIMIMLETVFLSMAGGPAGLLLSLISIGYFGKSGMDLGDVAYGDVGFATVIFPRLDLMSYIQVTIMVLVMSVIAAIYPAIKALSLNPVEAIRKI